MNVWFMRYLIDSTEDWKMELNSIVFFYYEELQQIYKCHIERYSLITRMKQVDYVSWNYLEITQFKQTELKYLLKLTL